ncbi:hypothetical protein C7S18_10420 [Ahniella affigens]|uniref:Uncharacterized protein n=1 Tax=Ahniella affigens TaxID=2021234 RepID=A0A2P1PRY5_9GAMM|nr:hypothetical protein [Ahniella affigens]AVP97585.1 hypothetical protein C7S18_10420 [Ahniella affigens]
MITLRHHWWRGMHSWRVVRGSCLLRTTALSVVLLLTAPMALAVEGSAWALLTAEQQEQVATAFAEQVAKYIDETPEEAKKEREQNLVQIELLRELDRINQQDGTRTSDEMRSLVRRLYGPTEAERVLEGIRNGQPRRRHRAETKQLRDLLDELEKPEASWQRRYAQQYGRMLLTTGLRNAKKYSELAGDISGGEYGKVKATIAEAGTAAFKQVVSDALDAYGYDDTKLAFLALIENIDDIRPLAQHFLRGDWGQLILGLRDLGTKKLKTASKSAVAASIDWVLDPIASGTGATYVGLLESEVELLTWGREVLNRKATKPCLDLYVQTYQRISPNGESLGAADQAYDDYKLCSERSFGAFGFRGIDDFARENGIDEERLYRQMAEDYRHGDFTFASQWLADRIEERKQNAEKKLLGDLTAVQVRMDAVGGRFNRASTDVLNNLIAGVLGDAQLAELEAKARAAILESADIADRIKRAHSGVLGNCTAFDAALADMARTQQLGAELDSEAQAVNISLKNFQGCAADAAALSVLRALDAPSITAFDQLARAVTDTESEMQNTCRLRESQEVLADRETARAQLDALIARGARVKQAAAEGRAAAQTLTDSARRADGADIGDDGQARAQLATWLAQAATLPSGLAPLQQRLGEAKGRMAQQLASGINLERFAQDQAARIKPILAPHRGSPLRAQVLALEDEVTRMVSDIAACRRDMADTWSKGSDGALPGRLQKLITPELDDLPIQTARAEKLCPVPTQSPAALRLAILARADGVDESVTLISLAEAAADRCVAEANVAFDTTRSDPAIPVTPDPARSVYQMVDVKPDAIYGTWKTVADGTIVFGDHEGDHKYTGTLNWASPPASIGPEGFSITLNAQCEAGKSTRLATGINLSAEGFLVTISAADSTPVTASAPANCDLGQSNAGSITVHVKPWSNPSPGTKAKIRVGAFWGLGVDYFYEAR